MRRRDPLRSHQLELPLGKVQALPRVPPATPRASPAPAGLPEWRLDDETCRLGRAGVAAARQLLSRPSRRATTSVVGGEDALESSRTADAAA